MEEQCHFDVIPVSRVSVLITIQSLVISPYFGIFQWTGQITLDIFQF